MEVEVPLYADIATAGFYKSKCALRHASWARFETLSGVISQWTIYEEGTEILAVSATRCGCGIMEVEDRFAKFVSTYMLSGVAMDDRDLASQL